MRGFVMGAAATGTVAGNRACKEGKRYYWGAERPSVIERRVQLRKKQIDIEIAQIREELEKEIARKVAAKEAERLKVLDQEVLLAKHREDVKRRRAFRKTSSYIVPKGTFTDEQVAAIKAQYPGIDDEEAHFLLSKRARQTAEPDISGPKPVSPQETDAAVLSASIGPAPFVEQRAEPVQAPKAVSTDKPKPTAVHIEASVTFSAGAGETECDWSDFDPEAWEEGQPYPEHLYRAVQDQDRNYYLVPNTEMDDSIEPVVTPEIRALRDRRQELEKALDDLFEKFGRNSMLWTAEVNAKVECLDQERTEVAIQLRKALAAQ
jgi:hypothetical protein